MMKYVETKVCFEEIPNEITLCINISNCPYHCQGCHSQHLWQDVGTELTYEELARLTLDNDGITCVCLMGHGDPTASSAEQSFRNAERMLMRLKMEKGIKTAIYTGGNFMPDFADKPYSIDYLKVGRYMEERGPLNSPTTNQRMYKNPHDGCGMVDITSIFQSKR